MDVAVTRGKIFTDRVLMPGLLLLFVLVVQTTAAQTTLRVGVYENAPKIFLDTDSQPGGMLGELLAEIAQREGWQLEPVPCQWNDCLQMLESGAIGLAFSACWT